MPPFIRLSRSAAICLSLMALAWDCICSLAASSLLFLSMRAISSSWLCISRFVRMVVGDMSSLYPPVVSTSSKANMISNACSFTACSDTEPVTSGTTFARRRRVPRSSTMLLALVVIRRRNMLFSSGW